MISRASISHTNFTVLIHLAYKFEGRHLISSVVPPVHPHVSSLLFILQVATVSERSRIMELEREVADLQLRLRASQQKEDTASLSQQQISSLKAQVQSQEKKVCVQENLQHCYFV